MYDSKFTEQQVLKFWQQKKTYEKLKQKNKRGKRFYFLQGPPYTSGKLHIGHALNNCLKDTVLRQKRMLGLNVWDRAGYDMHGLPTENAVQKLLKLRDKKAILQFGLKKFIKECKKFALARVKEMDADLMSFGVWLDFKNAYYPLDNDFMSNEWLLIKKAYEQKRLYKGKKIMHWCASCETALAKHELEYENVKDTSIFLKFKIKDKKNEFLIIWTTTPWTIPFNLGVMVNPEIKYVKAKVNEEVWIIAKALANVVITSVFEKKFKILGEFKGKSLEGLEYEHPLNELKDIYKDLKKKHKNIHTVLLSEEYVATDTGSGLVHCAPGCGPEDFEIGKKYDIPAFNTLDEKGVLNDFNGMIAKKDDSKIVELLKKKGSLLAETEVEHEYPFCWRCHKQVIFRATEQWFLKIEGLIPFMLKENEKVEWVPKWAKEAFDSWTKSLRDNGITRQRYWGTPVPIWKCDSCNNIEVIGSEEELKKKAITKIPEDLHKPDIDSVKLKCKCGKEMDRILDVLDVWLDAGTTSWNCLYYPKKQEYFKKWFPADFILEGNEHIRLWFSMLAICSSIVFKKSCFKSAFIHGMILDWQGTKMSKSLGNIISPYEVVDKVGVDIFRYYMTEARAGENMNFSWEDLKIKQRNIQILWNIKNYLVELSKLHKFNPSKNKPSLEIEEKYMLSKVNSTIKKVSELFEKYKLDETIKPIENLYLELSRFYIQLIREEIVFGNKEKKKAIIWTIYNTLLNCLKIFSPVCPFITEAIFQELKKEFKLKEESIHLCFWPKADEKAINKKLEQNFILAQEIIEKTLAARSEAGIGIRWPLGTLTIVTNQKLSSELQKVVMKQTNIKNIRIKTNKTKKLEIKLDTKLTTELEAEGYAREIARFIQGARKKAGLNKKQSISLQVFCDKKLQKYIDKYKSFIKERVNASKFSIKEKIEGKFAHEYAKEIKKNKIKISFNVLK